MGKLPIERLKPAPAWDSTALDFFGPFKVKKLSKEKDDGKSIRINIQLSRNKSCSCRYLA